MSSGRTSESGNIVVGVPDVDPEAPSHVRGVHQGNWPSRRWRRRQAGARSTEFAGIVGPSRSTGIDPERRWPIDPRMPRLTPP